MTTDPAPPTPTRRTVVLGGTLAVGAGVVLAGCGSSGNSAGTGTAAAPAATGTVLGPSSEIPVGSAKIYSAAGVVVTQATAGTYTGFSTVCPHQQCAVAQVEGATIICPCHNSHFSLDGQVTQGPAQTGLTPKAVTVTGTDVTLA